MGPDATEELRELRDTLRRFFADASPSARVRRLMATDEGYDPRIWAQMAGQLGLQGLAVPERFGGAGYGMRELAVVMEEMGRALVCAPFLSSVVLAGYALLGSGDEDAARDLLPGIADGSAIAALAWMEDERWDPDRVRTAARPAPGGWVLDGAKTYVLDGGIADLILVVADREGRRALFAVRGDADGLARTPLPTLDQTRKMARLEFRGAPARPVGAYDPRVMDLAAVALAAEQLGGMQRALEMTVEYVKVRRQFGRPIGSFQAVKHRCADMFVLVESARSAVAHAADVADGAPEELPVAAALAQAYCSEAFFRVAAETVQLHGGIGFTWEHDAHLYFKRAASSRELLGSPAAHRRRLAELVGITGAAPAP
ncbi:acyl-CoA dehydrogenase [Actinomadura rubrobrunea]|uniref:Acyl-CoA dehydrogenase n=1 Tax=Actinomadura rubrobrunea TaxID=115335 RepID=A0A9W6PWX7_9ACTN|nr:acyl-CoA dehydrogenase family protein [Actinomadura rubrobrunea]GLW64272.1 acyl-CoA dehydrogenase [Actinomadura rubrobrunea]